MVKKDLEFFHECFIESSKSQVEIGLKTIYLLFLSNAGAIIAILGFLSHTKEEKIIVCLYNGLWFVCGIVFTILTYFFGYLYQAQITRNLNRHFHYHKAKMDYSDLLKDYNTLSQTSGFIKKLSKEVNDHQLKMHENIINLHKYIEESIIILNKKPCDTLLYICMGFGAFSLGCFLIGSYTIISSLTICE